MTAEGKVQAITTYVAPPPSEGFLQRGLEALNTSWEPVADWDRHEVRVPCVLNGARMPARKFVPYSSPADLDPQLVVGIDPLSRSAEKIQIRLIAPASTLFPASYPIAEDELYQLSASVDLHKPLRVHDTHGNIVERRIGEFDRADIGDSMRIAMSEMGVNATRLTKQPFRTNFLITDHALRKTIDHLSAMSPRQLEVIIAESAARDEVEYMLHVHRGVIAIILEGSFQQGKTRGKLTGSLEDYVMDLRTGKYQSWEDLLAGASTVPVIMHEKIYAALAAVGRIFAKNGAEADEVADNWIRQTGSLHDRLDALGPIGVMVMAEIINRVAQAQVNVAVAKGQTALMEAATHVVDARLEYLLRATRAATKTTIKLAGVPLVALYGAAQGANDVRKSLGSKKALNPPSGQILLPPVKKP